MFSIGGSGKGLWQTPLAFIYGCHRFDPHRHHLKKAGLAERGLPPLSAEEFTSGHVVAVVNEISQSPKSFASCKTIQALGGCIISILSWYSVGEQRMLGRSLIFTVLEVQAVICVKTGSRTQAPEMLFCAAGPSLPSQRSQASVFVKIWYLN